MKDFFTYFTDIKYMEYPFETFSIAHICILLFTLFSIYMIYKYYIQLSQKRQLKFHTLIKMFRVIAHKRNFKDVSLRLYFQFHMHFNTYKKDCSFWFGFNV